MNFIWILVIVIILIVLNRLYNIWGRRPVIHKNIPQEDLIYSLKELYLRGYNGGYIVIQVPTDDKKFKRFVQLSKYIVRKGKVGLEFDYPLAEWSKPYYDQLKEILAEEDVTFEIQKTDEEMVTEFLNIDFKKDLEKAAHICRLIFQRLYGLKPDDCVELFYVNVNPKDEWVGLE